MEEGEDKPVPTLNGKNDTEFLDGEKSDEPNWPLDGEVIDEKTL